MMDSMGLYQWSKHCIRTAFANRFLALRNYVIMFQSLCLTLLLLLCTKTKLILEEKKTCCISEKCKLKIFFIFYRNQSQKSLHHADCSWRFVLYKWSVTLLKYANSLNTGKLCCFFSLLLLLKTKLLKKAMIMLEEEKQRRQADREKILDERFPALQLSGLSMQELQVYFSL